MVKKFSNKLYNKLYIDFRTNKVSLYVPHSNYFSEIEFSLDSKFGGALVKDKIYNFNAFKLLMENIFDHLQNKSGTWDRVFGYNVVAIINNKYNEVELNALEDAIKFNNVHRVDFIESPIPQNIFVSSQNDEPTIYLDFSKNNIRICFTDKLKVKQLKHIDIGIETVLNNLAKFVNSKYGTNINLFELESELLKITSSDAIQTIKLINQNADIELLDIKENLSQSFLEITSQITKFIEEITVKNQLIKSDIKIYLGGDVLKFEYLKEEFNKVFKQELIVDIHHQISKFIGINILIDLGMSDRLFIKDTLML